MVMHRYIIELTPQSIDPRDPRGNIVTFIRQRRNTFGIWVEEHKRSLSFPTLVEARAACTALILAHTDADA